MNDCEKAGTSERRNEGIRHLSGKRHEINERSEFMNDPAKRRRRRWSGVSDMNDREKAGTSERRNEGDYNAGIPRTSSTLWMKDTICSFECLRGY